MKVLLVFDGGNVAIDFLFAFIEGLS